MRECPDPHFELVDEVERELAAEDGDVSQAGAV
jgi:hypothetical protein